MNPQPSPPVTTAQTPAKRSNKRLIILSVIGALVIAGVIGYFAWYNLTGQGYWDGGQYAGQPVYSQDHGISRTLHDQFQACGLSDSDVTSTIQTIQENLANGVTFPATVNNVGPNGQDTGPSITVNLIGPGVYTLTCQKSTG